MTMRMEIGIAAVALTAAALIAGAALYRRTRARPDGVADWIDDAGASMVEEEPAAEPEPAPV